MISRIKPAPRAAGLWRAASRNLKKMLNQWSAKSVCAIWLVLGRGHSLLNPCEKRIDTLIKTLRRDVNSSRYIQITVKRGLTLYFVIAALAVPAGLCSQQNRMPFYEPPPFDLQKLKETQRQTSRSAPLPRTDDADAAPASLSAKIEENEDLETNMPYYTHIVRAAESYQVDAALIRAIIMAESGYNPNAVSHRGAQGLMQLMPKTAKWLGIEDSFDPALNIDGGVRYFRRLLDRFEGDVRLALAAYNAGSRHVREYGGVPPFKATRHYIDKVMRYHRKYQQEMAAYEGVTPSV